MLDADDTNLLVGETYNETLYSKVNDDLSHLSSCYDTKCSVLNPSETTHVLFRSSHRKLASMSPELILDMSLSRTSQSAELLGVILDEPLKFQNYTILLSQRWSLGISTLINVRHFLNESLILSLYTPFMHSRSNYCIAACETNNTAHLNLRIVRLRS